eukprot:scaffold223065_cov23-Attheya_sp.AAC.1
MSRLLLISGSGYFLPRFFVSAVRLERRSPSLGYIGHAMRAALYLDRFGAIEFFLAAAAAAAAAVAAAAAAAADW